MFCFVGNDKIQSVLASTGVSLSDSDVSSVKSLKTDPEPEIKTWQGMLCYSGL